jgi:hypothetical protein
MDEFDDDVGNGILFRRDDNDFVYIVDIVVYNDRLDGSSGLSDSCEDDDPDNEVNCKV